VLLIKHRAEDVVALVCLRVALRLPLAVLVGGLLGPRVGLRHYAMLLLMIGQRRLLLCLLGRLHCCNAWECSDLNPQT
jgi:hypothetical protein